MPNIVIAPTPAVLRVTSLINQTIKRFLKACRSVPPLGKFESEVEAMKLLVLVVRHVESITQLAKVDLVLVPSANVIARAVFEIAVKAAWMITPSDPFDREVRWLAHIEEEERMHDKIATRVIRHGGDHAHFQSRRDTLRSFRTGVLRPLPPGYAALPGNPSVEQMLESIGQKKVYGVYTLLAAYVHGGHASTSLYRRNLGTLEEHGEFIDSSSWYLALWTSSKVLQILGAYVLERLKAEDLNLVDDDREIEAALYRLSNEKTGGEE